MKPFKCAEAIVIIVGIASLFPLQAATSWKYIGMKGEVINTILPIIGNSPNGIMVGTNTGIWHFEYSWWDHSFNGLPVHDIIITPGGQILAAMGNGSDSDGVYIGKVVAIGEPGTRWGFSLLVKCPQPTALAFEPMEGSCIGRLYVGTAEDVRSGLLCKDSVRELTAITGFPNPFVITSMVIGSDDGMLYAGGRDDIFPQPGPGPVKYSWLLRGNATGLTALKKLKATSIVEMPVQRGPDDGPIRYIAVATVDSGIQTFVGSSIYRYYHSPVQQDPVFSIVPFKTLSSMNWTQLVAATPTGVFGQCPPNADCEWSKMEGLPGSPKCLAQYNGTILWAGTDSGVYRYGNMTATDRKSFAAAPLSMGVKSINTGNGNVFFELNNNLGNHGMLTLYDTRGRRVINQIVAGRHTIISNIGKGLYLYRVTVDKKIPLVGKMTSY